MRKVLPALLAAWLIPASAPAQADAPAAPADDEAASPAAADAGLAAKLASYWHLPRRRDWRVHGGPLAAGAPDWNPLSGPARALKRGLEELGLRLDIDTALYFEHASEHLSGEPSLGTFSWQGVGDWRLLGGPSLGTTYLGWTLLGSPGLNYDSNDQSLSGNVGSVSGLNGNVFPDPAALDELFLKYVSPEGKLVVLLGRVDQSFYFDTNRIANDAFREFFAYALENNRAIPFSTYGGVGALLRFQLSSNVYVMGAAGTSRNDEPWAFWKSADEGDWGEALEIGLTAELPGLGQGHYRLTPWHNHVSGRGGFGLGLNFDQELGLDWLVAFFRFGIGDDAATPVERFVSGGLAFESPFGRARDRVAVGVAWSDPSPGTGDRNETLLELLYRCALSPSVVLTPDLQIVLDPADNARDSSVLVGGVRLELRF